MNSAEKSLVLIENTESLLAPTVHTGEPSGDAWKPKGHQS